MAVVAILAASYWVTRSLGRMSAWKQQSSYMKVADQLILGQEKSLAIVTIGVSHYLIGISKDDIKLLKEIEEEDLIPLPRQQTGLPGEEFAERFRDLRSLKNIKSLNNLKKLRNLKKSENLENSENLETAENRENLERAGKKHE